MPITGTGTPPTAPRSGAPRFSAADPPDGPAQINGVTDVFDALMTLLPAGVVIDWAGSGDIEDADGVTRWLVCDGRAISRTTYATLLSRIGTTYGVGDGANTFNIPNGMGRNVVGAGTGSSLTARSLGQASGEELHALATGELPSHGHGVNDPEHAHGLLANGYIPQTDNGVVGATIGDGSSTGPASGGSWESASVTNQSTTGISVQNTGSNSPHNNMPPFLVLNHIIKVL